MYDIYFYWENRQSATKTLREFFSEAIEAAQKKALKHSNLMSVEIVDEDYARVILSREELLRWTEGQSPTQDGSKLVRM